MTCQITLYEAVPVGLDETLRAVPYPCGRPVVRMGLCARHAEDHERLCDGCSRCSRPDERYPCGCVRYGDRWVPEGCAMHAAIGGVL